MRYTKVLFFLVFLFILFSFPFTASALKISPDAFNQDLELDVQGISSLYNGDNALETGDTPDIGFESRAMLKIRNMEKMAPDWGGWTDGQVWNPNDFNQSLTAVEKDIFITDIRQNTNTGETYIFFGDPTPDEYQFEVYLHDPEYDYINDVVNRDPNNWDTIYNDLTNEGTLLWAGGFTTSTYTSNWTGTGSETISALAGIRLQPGLQDGSWLSNDEQPTSPSGQSMNPQAWVDLTYQNNPFWVEDLWGSGKDLAIGNVFLQASDSGDWTSFADDWTRGATVPEPTTLLLFGTGLLGLAAFGRKRLTKQK